MRKLRAVEGGFEIRIQSIDYKLFRTIDQSLVIILVVSLGGEEGSLQS